MNYLKTFDLRFYKTKDWKEKRLWILKRDNYECQMCKADGKVTPATDVHHKLTYESRPDLALTDDNLLSLCKACHNKEHPEKFFEAKIREDIHEERWE